MTIIALANPKGGVGKTTTTVNLGRGLSLESTVMLVDSDKQQSLMRWHSASNGDLMPVIAMTPSTLSKDVKRIYGYEYILIDGAANDIDPFIETVKCADVVLIPVKISEEEVKAAAAPVDIISARQQYADGKPKAAFIISMDELNTTLSRTIADRLSRYNLPVFASRITNRASFAKTIDGSTVIDDDKYSKASYEIYKLVEELREFLK